jgi:hypothetical protein
MDTLLQDLRSALQTLGEHPAFTLAAAMSLGFGLETGAVPATPAPRHGPQAVPAAHVVAAPKRSVSWMDYIDFRRGSGDVLRWIGSGAVTDDSPRTCGVDE